MTNMELLLLTILVVFMLKVMGIDYTVIFWFWVGIAWFVIPKAIYMLPIFGAAFLRFLDGLLP